MNNYYQKQRERELAHQRDEDADRKESMCRVDKPDVKRDIWAEQNKLWGCHTEPRI